MKYILLIGRLTLAFILVIGSLHMAQQDVSGWGWVLILGFLMGYISGWKDDE